jgi:hypothetical protein
VPDFLSSAAVFFAYSRVSTPAKRLLTAMSNTSSRRKPLAKTFSCEATLFKPAMTTQGLRLPCRSYLAPRNDVLRPDQLPSYRLLTISYYLVNQKVKKL